MKHNVSLAAHPIPINAKRMNMIWILSVNGTAIMQREQIQMTRDCTRCISTTRSAINPQTTLDTMYPMDRDE